MDNTRPSSALSSPAAAGDKSIYVHDYKGFKPGTKIRIGKGRTAEERFVVALGSLVLDFPLQFAHEQDENVVCLKVSKDELKAFQRSLVVSYVRENILLPLVGSAVAIGNVNMRTTAVQKSFEDRVVSKPYTHYFKLHENVVRIPASSLPRQRFNLALLPSLGEMYVSGPSPTTRSVLCLQNSFPMSLLYHTFALLEYEARLNDGEDDSIRCDSPGFIYLRHLQEEVKRNKTLQYLFCSEAFDNAEQQLNPTTSKLSPSSSRLQFLDMLDMTSVFEGIATKSEHLDSELASLFHLHGDGIGCLPICSLPTAITHLGLFFPPSVTFEDIMETATRVKESRLTPSQFADLSKQCISCQRVLNILRKAYDASGTERLIALDGRRFKRKRKVMASLRPDIGELAVYDFKQLPARRGRTIVQLLEACTPPLSEWVSWQQIAQTICFSGSNLRGETDFRNKEPWNRWHHLQMSPRTSSWMQPIANTGSAALGQDGEPVVEVFQVVACTESSTLVTLFMDGRALLFDGLSDSLVFSKQVVTYEPVPSSPGDKEEDFLAWCAREDMDESRGNSPGSRASKDFASVFLSLPCHVNAQIIRISDPRHSSFLMVNTSAADGCIRFHDFGSGRRWSRLRVHIGFLRPCVAAFDRQHRSQQHVSSVDAVGIENFLILEDMNLLVCSVHGSPMVFVASLFTGEVLTKLVGHAGVTSPCLLHIDSLKLLLSGSPSSNDSTIRIWDIRNQLPVNLSFSKDKACQNARINVARLQLRINQRLQIHLNVKKAPCHGQWVFGEIKHVYKNPQACPWTRHETRSGESRCPIYEVQFEDGSFLCFAKGSSLKLVPKGRVFMGASEKNISPIECNSMVGETVAKWSVCRREYVGSLFEQFDKEGMGVVTDEEFNSVLRGITGIKPNDSGDLQLQEDMAYISRVCASPSNLGMAKYSSFLDLVLPESVHIPDISLQSQESEGIDTFCNRVIRFPTASSGGVHHLSFLETSNLIAAAMGDGSVMLLDPSSSQQCLTHPLRTFHPNRIVSRSQDYAAATSRLEWTSTGAPFSSVLRLEMAKSPESNSKASKRRIVCLDMKSATISTKAQSRPELMVTNALVQSCEHMLARCAASVASTDSKKTLVGGFIYLLFDGSILHLPTANAIFHRELLDFDSLLFVQDFEAAACLPPFSDFTDNLPKLRDIFRRRRDILRAAYCVSTEYPNLQSVVHVFNEKEILQKGKDLLPPSLPSLPFEILILFFPPLSFSFQEGFVFFLFLSFSRT